MGGAVIDLINNCGYLAGETISFKTVDEVDDFVLKYTPSLINDISTVFDAKIRITKEYVYDKGDASFYDHGSPTSLIGSITF